MTGRSARTPSSTPSTAASSSARGRRPPAAQAGCRTCRRRTSPLIGVATHRLARTIAKDPITSPIRMPFTQYDGLGGPAELHEKVVANGMGHAIGELLTCPFCLSQWVATGFVGRDGLRPAGDPPGGRHLRRRRRLRLPPVRLRRRPEGRGVAGPTDSTPLRAPGDGVHHPLDVVGVDAVDAHGDAGRPSGAGAARPSRRPGARSGGTGWPGRRSSRRGACSRRRRPTLASWAARRSGPSLICRSRVESTSLTSSDSARHDAACSQSGCTGRGCRRRRRRPPGPRRRRPRPAAGSFTSSDSGSSVPQAVVELGQRRDVRGQRRRASWAIGRRRRARPGPRRRGRAPPRRRR